MRKTFRENVAAGLCGNCERPRRADDQGTRTLCKTCGDGQRRRGLASSRIKAGIPLDAPRVKQGRPRTSYDGPPPGPQAPP
jgi:hypothetical protein